MKKLNDFKLFMLDMDGTIYLGSRLFDCTMPFLQYLKETGRKAIFLTNNSSKNRYAYVEKLARYGINVTPDEVFTSGEATTLWLNERKPGARVYLAGTPSLEEEFQQAGFILTDENPDYMVLGFDQTLTYEKLIKLCDFARAGVPYVCTHPDFNCPIDGGFIPDIGAMIAFIKASTGREPDIIVGKPNRSIAEAAMHKYGFSREEICMVGDRLYTDIALGANSGIGSILVYSGETTPEEYEKSDVNADFVFDDLAGIQKAMEAGL